MYIRHGYQVAMKSVKIAELRNRLSHYLRIVRGGEPVLVCDRDRVIARIEPAGQARRTGDERIADLERRGILRRGHGRIGRDLLARRLRFDADVVGALLRDRREDR
jgi:prevent-host-death family protein